MRLLLATALLLVSAPRVLAQAPDGWTLVWQEDFDARDAAFEARWDVGAHTFDGNEAQFVPQNVVVADGLLTLRLTRQPAGSRPYSGAELRTDNQTGFFRYGRFEARMKAARGSGVVSSLFTYRYDPWQEIDIEFKGRNTRAMQANIFYNAGTANVPYEVPPFPRETPLPYAAADAFHVYAFEWEPGIVRWFVDGVLVQQSENPAQVPYLPQQLMMNIWATTLAWAGPLDPAALPAEAQYDWVRVYRRDTGLVFDTFDDGDLSNVFTFSETGAGVGVGPTADAGGAQNRAVNVGIAPAGTGGYAGVVFAGDPGTMNASGAAVLTFKLRPTVQAGNLPLTLELNLHEDVNGNGLYDGGVEDEYQALVTVAGASGWRDVSVPLSAFTDDNSVFPGRNDGFDASRLLEIVVAIVGPTGPGYALAFDELAFVRATAAGEAAPAGLEVVLSPNPTRASPTLSLTLAEAAPVRIDVVDLLGRAVAAPRTEAVAAGASRIPLHLGGLAAGTYVVRVSVGGRVSARMVTLLR